jgi:predicted RecB family nuclease
MTQRLTASQLYSHLICPHRIAMDTVGDPALRDAISPFVQLLWDRGTAHELDVMATLGQPFVNLSALRGEAKEAATREAIARNELLIYGGRLSAHELLGEPDVLRREAGGYVAIDIKSGAALESDPDVDDAPGKPKKSYGVQLALYTHILEHLGLSAGRHGYIWDVHGAEVRYELDTPVGPRSDSLWALYLKSRAAVQATLANPSESRPALSSACKQCVWRSLCFKTLKRTSDLTLVPELGRARRDALGTEFATLQQLAAAQLSSYIDADGNTHFKGVSGKSLRRLQRRAALLLTPNAAPYLTRPISWLHAEVELFFDIEADPMRDLCYLHGFIIRETGRVGERFEGIFAAAATPAAERAAFAAAMTLLRSYPQALIVHYSRYERTAYRKLATKYPEVASAAQIEALFASPRALDLYTDVVRNGSEWPTHDFSIKSLARHCGFAWRDADPSGASSIEWFDQWARDNDPKLRQRLLDYNEDDCRAMRVVYDRMRALESPAMPIATGM